MTGEHLTAHSEGSEGDFSTRLILDSVLDAVDDELTSKDKITEVTVIKLNELKHELEDELLKPTPDEIRPACAVVLQYDDDESDSETFVVVNNPTGVKGVSQISPQSPLGLALIGKRAGKRFRYEVKREHEQTLMFEGTILGIG